MDIPNEDRIAVKSSLTNEVHGVDVSGVVADGYGHDRPVLIARHLRLVSWCHQAPRTWSGEESPNLGRGSSHQDYPWL